MSLITPSFGLIFWQTIIFLLMISILKKYAWNPILNFIEMREKYIEDSLEEAKKNRNEMYFLQFYKISWMKESNIQRELLLKESRSISNLIRLESIQRDKRDKKEIILHAKSLLEKEKEIVKSDIKDHIANLAIAIAEKFLKKELKKNKEQKDIIFNLIDINVFDKIRF